MEFGYGEGIDLVWEKFVKCGIIGVFGGLWGFGGFKVVVGVLFWLFGLVRGWGLYSR